MELNTKTTCDGVRVDRNLIPAYLTQLLTGTANFTIEDAYYCGAGVTCQSGNCGHTIYNVFVIKDNATGQTYNVGCQCVAKYGNNMGQLVAYWTRALESAKRQAKWQARRQMWANERDELKRKSIEAHQKELEFINHYLDIKASPFLESIQGVIEEGWDLSPKQREVLDRVMTDTDFVVLGELAKKDGERFQEILQMIEVLDKVKFGFYPIEMFHNLRDQFAKNGALSDKQVGVLRRLVHRFRKQIEKM